MPTVTFYNQNEIPDEFLDFAVIAARYNGKWIFCRHKERMTWEIPGGHREPGESILETAKRELHEETGAVEFDIKPVSVYGVTRYGMLFFADVKKLDELPPEMEIGEISLLETLPKVLTYPEIPYLHEHVQWWLNLQTNADELWDVYDENRFLTGRTHRRGDQMPKGDYHLVVYIWLQNSKSEYLLTKRTPNKGFPNMWECTGGSALAGDDSLTAAMREVKEETGLTVIAGNGKRIMTLKYEDCFGDVWLFRQDFELSDIVFQPNETCGAIYATKEDILKMREDGTLVPFSYLDEFFERVADLRLITQ
ncbi:MAG: NUDIX domain-containing protein [Oscillospiraceae bacterium]|nr:NUDIX domain-containing protein [Oscillospiraceae bacterium]